MGPTKVSSTPWRSGLWVALIAMPFASIQISARAGIIAPSDQSQSNSFPTSLVGHDHNSSVGSEMVLPDPSAPAIPAIDQTPEITVPQLTTEISATTPPAKDNANAIPLPPAVQSGLSGLIALGLFGGLRRLRRAFR